MNKQAVVPAKTLTQPISMPMVKRLLQRCTATQERNDCPTSREGILHRATQNKLSTYEVPATVPEVLRSPGKPLDMSVRTFMQSRFGHDFSGVRVHTDAKAERSARSVNALAYTVGNNIVFGHGQYKPENYEGQQLLAHELTHVLQQGAKNPVVNDALVISQSNDFYEQQADEYASKVVNSQRNTSSIPALIETNVLIQRKDAGTKSNDSLPKAPVKRVDVVLLMAEDLRPEALVLAPDGIVISVENVDEMIAKLKSIGSPIKTLYIISHSLVSGDLGFGNESTITFVRPEVVASKLKGTIPPSNAPEQIDFRGCSVGGTPKAMDEIRRALGASAAIGGNCFMVVQMNGPITVNGKAVTRPSEVNSGNRQIFEDGFKRLVDSFGEGKKKCILDTSEAAYFRTKGKMVAQWFSPELDTKWDSRKSKCYKDIKPETIDITKVSDDDDFDSGLAGNCRILKVVGP
jgi:hypothetical protein